MENQLCCSSPSMYLPLLIEKIQRVVMFPPSIKHVAKLQVHAIVQIASLKKMSGAL